MTSTSLKKAHSIPLLCLLLCNTALADGIGKIISATGTVTVNGKPLQRGADVSASDTIVTGDGSKVEIKLTDGTRFSVDASSAIKVSNYKTDPQTPAKNTATVDLLEGAVRTETGEIGKKNPDGFKVVTPIATVGIRGTDFTCRYKGCDSADKTNTKTPQLNTLGLKRKQCKDAKDKGEFDAIVHSGAISISNDIGTLFIGQGYPTMGAVVAGLSLPLASNNIAPPAGLAVPSSGGGGTVCFTEG